MLASAVLGASCCEYLLKYLIYLVEAPRCVQNFEQPAEKPQSSPQKRGRGMDRPIHWPRMSSTR